MNFVVIGTSHKYCPIEIREKLTFCKKRLRQALSSLLEYDGIKGAVILSTCNRTELYADVSDIEKGIASLKRFLADYQHQTLDRIAAYLYTYIGKEAVFHLFSVAAGIDSQIIGEPQILEQVKFAYCEAKAIEATDKILERVFNQAIEIGISVRKKTRISEGDISLGSLTIELIKKRLGALKDKRVLIIGTGKISELVVRHLRKEAVKTIFIANRTIERAYELAGFIKGEVVRFDKLRETLKQADVVISVAASPHLILKKEDILEALDHRPLLIIDLGLPRNVDPEIKHTKDVGLICLDDLNSLNIESLNQRKKDIPLVKKIITQEIESLCQKESLESEPAEVRLP